MSGSPRRIVCPAPRRSDGIDRAAPQHRARGRGRAPGGVARCDRAIGEPRGASPHSVSHHFGFRLSASVRPGRATSATSAGRLRRRMARRRGIRAARRAPCCVGCGLEVRRWPGPVGPLEHGRHQRGAEPAALGGRDHADEPEVFVRLVRVLLVHQADQLQDPVAVRRAQLGQLGGEPLGALDRTSAPRPAGTHSAAPVTPAVVVHVSSCGARMSTTRSKNARVAAGRAVSSGSIQRNTGSSVNATASAEATAAASAGRALRTSPVGVRTCSHVVSSWWQGPVATRMGAALTVR